MALVPSYIQRLANYKAGKPISEAQRELGIRDFIKLASNENPLGPSPKGMVAIQNSLKNLHRYPDATGYELRTKLAKRFNIKMENVVLGAGSEGIMSTIMRTFLLSDDELISAANSFIGFRVLANASGRRVHWVPMKNYRYDLEAMAAKITDYTKIIYIANPDNPMGTTITRQEFDEFDNVITLRTFSKAYGLAGIRIGYGFAHESLISNLLKVKVPFEPSLSAQAAGMAAMDDNEFLKNTLGLNKNGMTFLKKELDGLGIEQVPSAANFITTIWDSEETVSKLTRDLLEKGVIVRKLRGFGWPNCIRISVGLESENQKCIESLKEIL